MPRRTGQDPPPSRACRDPGRPAPARAREAAGRAGDRGVRPGGRQPLPVHGDRGLRCVAGGVPRADRHRGACHAARGREESPERRSRRRPAAVRRRPHLGSGRRLHPCAAANTGGGGVRPHGHLRRPRGVVDGKRPGSHRRRHRVPRVDRRYVGSGVRAPLWREPASARRPVRLRLRCGRVGDREPTARQGDVVQQLRRCRRRPPGRLRLRGTRRPSGVSSPPTAR
jgi:hypothetical protein